MGNSNTAQDALSKASKLSITLKKMEDGDEIDELTLPLQITTDYISGCSQQERLNHFNNVVKEFSGKKNDVSKEMTHFSDKVKLLDKKEFIKSVNLVPYKER